MKSSRFFTATALAGTLLYVTPSALAQDVTTEAVTPAITSAASDESDSLIVVTGSRIRLPNLNSMEPRVTVGSDYIESRNLTNIADALNEIPGIRGSITPNGDQQTFGQGTNFANMFRLGTNRTLTLVNGRRVVSSAVPSNFAQGGSTPGTQVDLNAIPSILIDRIDRVAIGGAPVYGSDAIAGTINVILKDRFDGLDLRLTNGITEYGDNHRFNVSGAYGLNFAGGRGNITLALSHEQVDGVVTSARRKLKGVGNLPNPTAAQAAAWGPGGRTPFNDGRINPNIGFDGGSGDNIPGLILAQNAGLPMLSRNGVVLATGIDFRYQFAADGTLVPYNPGTIYSAPLTSTASGSSNGDGLVFADYTQITGNSRRTTANMFFNYELTDNLRLFGEGMYYRGFADEIVQQGTLNATTNSGASSALTFSASDPRLSMQARNLLLANGVSTFRVSRVNDDLADSTGYAKNDLYRGVLGLSGQFGAFGGRSFDFEISGNYGRNDFVDYGQQIHQQRFVNAINNCVVAPAVNATPGFTPIADAACQPLDIFGDGRRSQAAFDYVVVNTATRSRMEQWVVNANVGGSPFDLFGNPVGFNIGYEHRNEKASFMPDAFMRSTAGRSAALSPLSGQYNLDEVFGEVVVPLFTPDNDFFFDSAQVFARGRYVDSTVNGGFFAWAAGGSFTPIRDIQLRGNYTKSFRAPAITELFLPTTNTNSTVPDICSVANRNAGPVPTVRAANCAAFLARYPGATPLTAATVSVPGRAGGNSGLENEEADSFTFGVIARPRFIPGLSIAVDYLNIRLKQPIGRLSVSQIAQACFDNPQFDAADPANGNSFCSRIRRDANGQVVSDPANPAVNSTYINGVAEKFDGIQATLDYRTSLSGINLPGTFAVGGELFYVRSRTVNLTGIAPARSDGTVGDPQFQGMLALRYATEVVAVSTYVNYTGEQMVSRFNRGPSPNGTREFDEFDDFVTINASVAVNVDPRMKLTMSVTNLTNRIGQPYYGVVIPTSVNDALGRRFAVSAAMQF